MPVARARRIVILAAGLAALGTSPSYIGAIVECAAQSSDTATGIGAALGAACLGVIGGLWLPRRLITWKLEQVRGWPVGRRRGREAEASDSSGEQTATIAAIVAMLSAAALIAQVVGVAVAERYRLALTQVVMLYAVLEAALLWIPLVAAIGLVSACVTMSISALVGLLRAVAGGRPRVAQFWVMKLACAGMGAVAGSGVTLMDWKPGQIAAATLGLTLPALIAGVVLITSAGRMSVSTADPTRVLPLARFGGRAPPAAGVAIASAMLGFVVHASGPWPTMDWVVAPVMAAALAISAPIATVVGRHWGASRGKLAVILLLIAATWVAPLEAALSLAATGIVRCAILAFLSGMMLVLAARRATARTGNIQTALYEVGIWSARCGAVAMLMPIVFGKDLDAPAIAPFVSGGLCISAMYFVCARIHPTAGNRLRGASPAERRAVVAAAVLIFAASFVVPEPAMTRPESGAPRVERPAFPRDRVAVCVLDAPERWAAGMAAGTTRLVEFGPDIDLQPVRFDLIVIGGIDRIATDRPDALVRLVRRCDAALLVQGRLLIESGNPLAELAARRAAGRLKAMSRPMVQRVSKPGTSQPEWTAIAIATDVRSWLRETAASDEGGIRIEPEGP